MTVIAAIRAAGQVFMASDSHCSAGDMRIADIPKIFEKRCKPTPSQSSHTAERVIVGYCGQAAMGPVFKHSFEIMGNPGQGNDPDEWAQRVAMQFTKKAVDLRITDKEGDMEGGLLLGWRDRLWEITDNLALPIETYLCMGSGGEVAQGALSMVLEAYGRYNEPSEDLAQVYVKQAVEAACRWMRNCDLPVHEIST